MVFKVLGYSFSQKRNLDLFLSVVFLPQGEPGTIGVFAAFASVQECWFAPYFRRTDFWLNFRSSYAFSCRGK